MDSTATITTGVETGRVRALLKRPIGWPTALISAGLGAYTLWGFSVPGGPSMGAFALLVLAWFGAGGYWLLRLVAALVAGGATPLRQAWRRWIVPPIVVMITVGLLMTSAPLLVRFNLSQNEMDQLARASESGVEILDVGRVGLFTVRSVESFDGGVRFLVNECMVDMCGFAYSSEGRPPNLGGEDSYYHLEGGWFLWEKSW